MLTHSEINAELEERGIRTYTVYATVDWTNAIVDHKTFVVPEALGVVADDFLFRAWDGDYQTDSTKFGQPQTCSVFAVPSDWKYQAECLQITYWWLTTALREAIDAENAARPEHEARQLVDVDCPRWEDTVYASESRRAEYQLADFRESSPIHYQHEITINGTLKREWRVRSERGILSAFSRLIDSTQARRDGAPTPVFSEAPEDPILGPPRKVVGPYSD